MSSRLAIERVRSPARLLGAPQKALVVRLQPLEGSRLRVAVGERPDALVVAVRPELVDVRCRARSEPTPSRPFMLAPPGGGAELREVRTGSVNSPMRLVTPGWQASCNVEHGAQVGRSSTKRPDAKAKSHSVKRTKAPPARRFVAGERP